MVLLSACEYSSITRPFRDGQGQASLVCFGEIAARFRSPAFESRVRGETDVLGGCGLRPRAPPQSELQLCGQAPACIRDNGRDGYAHPFVSAGRRFAGITAFERVPTGT
jgi:hypothetical protein